MGSVCVALSGLLLVLVTNAPPVTRGQLTRGSTVRPAQNERKHGKRIIITAIHNFRSSSLEDGLLKEDFSNVSMDL